MGNCWGAGVVGVRVLENVGVGMRGSRKTGAGGGDVAQVVHGINRGWVFGVWKGSGVSGKGGLVQAGRGFREGRGMHSGGDPAWW